MGNKVGNNPNIVLNNQNDDIIEYEGYEEFPIVEISNNNLKQEMIKPNPSLNNHSGGSSIGKYDSEHNITKLKDKIKDDKKENEEINSKLKNESKFSHNNQDQTNQNEEIKNENKENKDNNNIMNENNENNNEVFNNNNGEKEKIEEDIKNENINDNNIEQEKVEDKIEEQNNNIKEGNENMNINTQEEKDKDKMQLEENNLNENINNVNINKEDNITNEVQNQIKKEEIKNINNNNNDINNYIDKNNQQDYTIKNENKENENNNNNNENVEKNNNINEKKNENENNKNKNEEFAPKKIILPNINTIISEKVLEEGAGNELLFMSNLNKMVHISIKERVKYSEKFCITTKDNFLIYETRENYIKVKKPLAIIPINSIKNVVLFKLTKKVINYDHFYIEFQLDENNKNNVYNQIETFYMNDLDNNNENKGDTALVMFKTEEKNLAKKWYVLLKYLVELKSKN